MLESRKRAWKNQRGKKTLLSLTVVRHQYKDELTQDLEDRLRALLSTFQRHQVQICLRHVSIQNQLVQDAQEKARSGGTTFGSAWERTRMDSQRYLLCNQRRRNIQTRDRAGTKEALIRCLSASSSKRTLEEDGWAKHFRKEEDRC
eukprot:765116-Hanusia_phi.AAC.11